MEEQDIVLDASQIQPHALKHQTIFSKFDSLKDKECFILKNDHDPLPLFFRLQSMYGKTFGWEYVEKGPAFWQVRITRHLSEKPEATVADLVAEDFRRAEVLRKHGIDFYSSNRKPLKASCEEVKVDYVTVAKEIKAVDESRNRYPDNFNVWGLDFLSDYIVHNHHANVRASLPLLLKFSDKVAELHGESNPETLDIALILTKLSEDLLKHLDTEEKYLFPYVKKMLAAKQDGEKLPKPGFGSLEGPIKNHFDDHDSAIELMNDIRKLSNNYTAPEYSCDTFVTLYNELYEFERDLQQHIHLENNILFHKAIALEKEVVEG